MMTRRDLMRLMLASAIAESVDVEKLLWVPKPIITVPAMPYGTAIVSWQEIALVLNFHLADMSDATGQWISLPASR